MSLVASLDSVRQFSAHLTPDRDEARELLERELQDPKYQDPAPWYRLGRFLEQLLGQLSSGFGMFPSFSLAWGPILLIIVVLVVIVIAVLMVRPRLQRGHRDTPLEMEPGVSAEELLSRAEALLQSGAVDEAFRTLFHALVRAAEERDLLPELPGRTATEAAQELSAAFGAEQRRLRRAAELFNLSRYGGRKLRREDVDELHELCEALAATTPHQTTASWSPAQVVAPR